MVKNFNYLVKSKPEIYINISDVLRNTYMLLSCTILFSALMAFLSIKLKFVGINIFLNFIILMIMLYSINFFKNGIMGLLMVFIFTGFIGFSLGPILTHFLYLKHGYEIIALSMFLTGAVFFLLSLYVLFSKRSFDFLKGFISIGFIAVFALFISNFFLNFSIISLIISGFFIILSSACILYETSNILDGTEKNYILATISLYVQIYNLFASLLNIFTFFINDKD